MLINTRARLRLCLRLFICVCVLGVQQKFNKYRSGTRMRLIDEKFHVDNDDDDDNNNNDGDDDSKQVAI